MNKKVIIGIVAATLVVVVIAVGVVQGSRLKAALSVAKSATMNEEQVEAKSQENAQMQQEIRDQYEIPEVQLSEELQAALADGSMTLEEAAQQLISGGTAASSGEGESASETAEASELEPTPTQTPSENESTQTQTPSEPEPASPSESEPVQTQTPSESGTAQTQTPSESKPAQTQTPSESEPAQTQTPSENKPAQTQTPSENKPAQTQTPSRSEPAQTQTPSGEEETASLSGEVDDGPTEEEKAAEAARKAQEETNARVQNLFTQLYVLRDAFSNRVDAIINECIDEFLALDPSQQTRTMKIRIVYGRMDKLSAMEAECDAQVEAIAAELDGIDPSLGEKARQQYRNEKELKKSSLIAQYGG